MSNKTTWPLPLMISLLVSSIVCLLMPISTYESNPYEFSRLAYFEVLYCSVGGAVVVASLVFLTLLLVRHFCPNAYMPFVGLVFGLSIALYAQGNLIGADYGRLDGHIIQWEAMHLTAVVNTLIWCACIITPILGAMFWPKRAEWVFQRGVPIFLAYVMLFLFILVSTNDSVSGHKKPMRLSLENFMELSSERNVVIIVLDAFDRALFDKLLDADPTWRRCLSGLTYYHNAVSAFCYTNYAVPQIVSGCSHFEGDISVWQYQRKAYHDAPFLRRAKALGFEIDGYFDEPPSDEDFLWAESSGKVIENANKYVSSDNLKYYWALFSCSAFKYLPHELKKFWCEVGSYFNGDICVFSEEVERCLSSRLLSESFSLVSAKKVKIYHCFSVHLPSFSIEKAKESLELVSRFVNKVREAGVYDKTDFFIMADHGSINRCRPLFMCSNGTDEFKVSEMPFSYRHLCEAFSDSLNGLPIRPVEASPAEMVPIIDDPERLTLNGTDGMNFDGIGTEFSGNGLELLATTAEMDVVVTNGNSRMIWNGKEAIIGVPVDNGLRDGELSLTLTFDQVISNGLKLVGRDASNGLHVTNCVVTSAVGYTDVSAILPNIDNSPDKRFVKFTLCKWEGTQPAPAIVKVKLALAQ